LEEIRCHICDNALSLVGMLGKCARGDRLPGISEVQLENDGSGQYFRCPYCSSRNVTIMTTAGNGRPAVQVAWAVMNGD
jgi:DNA-directed RNA polymerase subunit RPC12/RpoP